MNWRSRHRRRYNPRRRRRHNPLYKDAELLSDAKKLLDEITARASKVMGENVDPMMTTILPEDTTIDATPLAIVAAALTPPGSPSEMHYHQEVMKDLLTDEIARSPDKRYWDVVNAFEGETGEHLLWEDSEEGARPRLPARWTTGQTKMKYGREVEIPGTAEFDMFPWNNFDVDRDQFTSDMSKRRLRRRNRRRRY
jgi:hypothetical protein